MVPGRNTSSQLFTTLFSTTTRRDTARSARDRWDFVECIYYISAEVKTSSYARHYRPPLNFVAKLTCRSIVLLSSQRVRHRRVFAEKSRRVKPTGACRTATPGSSLCALSLSNPAPGAGGTTLIELCLIRTRWQRRHSIRRRSDPTCCSEGQLRLAGAGDPSLLRCSLSQQQQQQ